jgi:hypothetical protein
VIAKPDRPRHAAGPPAESMATPDVADREASKVLANAVQEAQAAGDREVSGQHVLLAMCVGPDNGGWLALRWAGAAPRPFTTAAVRASGNTTPHHESVPLSGDLRRALEDGYRTAGQPLSAAAVLASLMRNQEAGSMQTIAETGLLRQDVLAAIVALARIGEIDAAAGKIAAAEHPVQPGSGRPRLALIDAARRSSDDPPGNKPDQVETPGWAGPDREAAMSMLQFRLAAASTAYLLLLVLALITLVDAATHDHLWLLALAPLLGLGNPRLGTWSLAPVAVLFWLLHLPALALLVVAWIPVDAAMGALMLHRRRVAQSGFRNRDDCHVGVLSIVGAVGRGAGTGK